jgi:hypothetical protein
MACHHFQNKSSVESSAAAVTATTKLLHGICESVDLHFLCYIS